MRLDVVSFRIVHVICNDVTPYDICDVGRLSMSRESTTVHSEKAVKLMQEPVVDSPGPPPPSPEPKDHQTPAGLSKENTGQ